jgi:type VI secretion system secreted protein VgrG
MTKEHATDLYRVFWWEPYRYGEIVSDTLATKVFDYAVNVGQGVAAKIAQEASGAFVDGHMGSETIAALNAQPWAVSVQRMSILEDTHYRNIVLARPQDAQFLAGWLKRAKWPN